MDPAVKPSKAGMEQVHTRLEDSEYHEEKSGENRDPTSLHESDAANDSFDAASDDEAPDSVTAHAAQEEAQSQLKRAGKAVDQKRSDEKRKRQEKDALLKKQSKKKRRETAQGGSENDDDEPKIPEMLPDEVLADEEAFRPRVSEAVGEEKMRVSPLERTSLPRRINEPKDIRVGPVNVSVLERRSNILAPKARRHSRSLRESWLYGRSATDASQPLQRKRVGASFVS